MAKTDIPFRFKRSPPSQCTTSSNPWMVNAQDLDPCKQVEQLCTQGPAIKLGTVTGNLSCPSTNTPQNCCCTWATYALLSACWVCQGHSDTNIDTGIKPSYGQFFNNSGCHVSSVSDIPSQLSDSAISPWASIVPSSLSNHWNFTEAQQSGLSIVAQQGISQQTTIPVATSSTSTVPATRSSSTSSDAISPSGTIAASVLGSFALTSLISICAWFFWRWRRRYAVRLDTGTKVDLMEPEMEGPSRVTNDISGTADPLRRVAIFPFPYQAVVPRHHPNLSHSFGPTGTDARTPSDPDPDPENPPPRRHTSPAPFVRLPMDQLDRDLARLQGVEVSSTSQTIDAPSPLGEGMGQVHHPYINKTPRKRAATITTFTSSSNSGSGHSRRPRRMSGGDDVVRGRYFHLPPSAQYLANVARYPEKVDPERPWDIRRDGRVS